MDKPVPRRTWDAQYAGRGYESAVVWGDTGEQDWEEHVFFFQAEDGIRDIGVTGVQTCALPILPNRDQTEEAVAVRWLYRSEFGGERLVTRSSDPPILPFLGGLFALIGVGLLAGASSEERRLGQERRSPWSAYD